MSAGDYARAAESFRQALCLAPDSADVYHGLGLAEAAAGHFDRAGKALAQADRLSPHNFTILLVRAQVETSAGNFELASRMLKEAERLPAPARPTRGAAWPSFTANSAARSCRKDSSIWRWRNCFAPRGPAFGILRLSDAGHSREQSRRLQRCDSRRNRSRRRRGCYHCRNARPPQPSPDWLTRIRRNDEEAVELLKRSIELTPGEPAYLALAEIYEMNEKPAEAAKLLEQGNAALPGSQKIALAFGRTLVDAGDHQRAAAVLSGITQQDSADVGIVALARAGGNVPRRLSRKPLRPSRNWRGANRIIR